MLTHTVIAPAILTEMGKNLINAVNVVAKGSISSEMRFENIKKKIEGVLKLEQAQRYVLHISAEYGVSPPTLPKTKLIDFRDSHGCTAVFWAVYRSDQESVHALLNAGADPCIPDNKDQTPLIHATFSGTKEIASMLIDKSANLDTKTKVEGLTVAHYAVISNKLSILCALLARDRIIKAESKGETPLMDIPSSDGRTPLWLAAERGHEQIVKVLIGAKANLDIQSEEYKNTALTLAAWKGFDNIVRLLIAAGAKIELLNCEDRSALDYAVEGNHLSTIRLLLDASLTRRIPIRNPQEMLTFLLKEEYREHPDALYCLASLARVYEPAIAYLNILKATIAKKEQASLGEIYAQIKCRVSADQLPGTSARILGLISSYYVASPNEPNPTSSASVSSSYASSSSRAVSTLFSDPDLTIIDPPGGVPVISSSIVRGVPSTSMK